MTKKSHLLHPELIEAIPFNGSSIIRTLNQYVGETLVDDPADDPDISIVIRTLNEAAKLEQLFEDIHHQFFSSEVEVVVVDNESSDETPQVAKYHGAEVVTLPRNDFTYPKSMNLGVAAASNAVVFLTIGHARLSNTYNLHAGARHFRRNDGTAGAFGLILPNEGASRVEWLAGTASKLFLASPTHRVKKVKLGALGATNAMIAKPVWRELGGFDERYETGGEDTVLAKLMLENGYGLVRDAALAVHHSHGLGLTNSIKQVSHWHKTQQAPRRFDRGELLARRPDLRSNGLSEEP